METILIVDDEPAIREMIAMALTKHGYQSLHAADAEEAGKIIAAQSPDLVLLDLMLPGRSGMELARQLRKDTATRLLPIIMLTARGEENDKVQGLETGADDYVTKPFSVKELMARIKSVLRRSRDGRGDEELEIDGLLLNSATHRVSINGRQLSLAPTEFQILQFLMQHPERVHSRARLLDAIWPDNVHVEERTVDVHIRRLRQVLEESGHDRLVQTVRGAGYRLSREN